VGGGAEHAEGELAFRCGVVERERSRALMRSIARPSNLMVTGCESKGWPRIAG
jgi:hypothetical protein